MKPNLPLDYVELTKRYLASHSSEISLTEFGSFTIDYRSDNLVRILDSNQMLVFNVTDVDTHVDYKHNVLLISIMDYIEARVPFGMTSWIDSFVGTDIAYFGNLFNIFRNKDSTIVVLPNGSTYHIPLPDSDDMFWLYGKNHTEITNNTAYTAGVGYVSNLQVEDHQVFLEYLFHAENMYNCTGIKSPVNAVVFKEVFGREIPPFTYYGRKITVTDDAKIISIESGGYVIRYQMLSEVHLSKSPASDYFIKYNKYHKIDMQDINMVNSIIALLNEIYAR